MANLGTGIFVFLVFSHKSLYWELIQQLELLISCFFQKLITLFPCHLIFSPFFILRYRENKFPLIEGSYYENLFSLLLAFTNRVLQQLVINVMEGVNMLHESLH